MFVNLEWVAGSRRTGEGLERLASLWVYKKIYMCVNLELVAGSRWTCEGLDELVSKVV